MNWVEKEMGKFFCKVGLGWDPRIEPVWETNRLVQIVAPS